MLKVINSLLFPFMGKQKKKKKRAEIRTQTIAGPSIEAVCYGEEEVGGKPVGFDKHDTASIIIIIIIFGFIAIAVAVAMELEPQAGTSLPRRIHIHGGITETGSRIPPAKKMTSCRQTTRPLRLTVVASTGKRASMSSDIQRGHTAHQRKVLNERANRAQFTFEFDSNKKFVRI